MLMAKRLVAAGVRFVSLTYRAAGYARQHRELDEASTPDLRSSLCGLDQRSATAPGPVKDTLVMVSSEFGRTPKINNTAGRDHWPKVFSVALAGGGIKGGITYGTSNAIASEPEDDPVGPQDLATTVYNQLGIVADKELMAPAIVRSKSSTAAA